MVGLGISGLSTAIRLRQLGWDPLIIERSAQRRTDGYFVGLFGTGAAAARRLGILDGLADRTSGHGAIYEVDRAGGKRRCAGFHELPGVPRVVLRSDIEAAAYDALPQDVEIRFATVPTAIEHDAHGADVTMVNTGDGTTVTERFDLVVGADGVGSAVRELVFGHDRHYLHSLDYMLGAVKLKNPLPGVPSDDGVILAENGRSMWVFPFADTTPAVLFAYRTRRAPTGSGGGPIDRLRTAFGPEPLGDLLSAALLEFERADNPLFGLSEQVRMDRWHRDRIVLLGDSAWCMTLSAGMGASAGMAAAELLGDALARHPGRIDVALKAWEHRLRPFIHFHQREAVRQRQFFVPANRLDRVVRSVIMRGLISPRADWLFRLLLNTIAAKAQRMRATDLSVSLNAGIASG